MILKTKRYKQNYSSHFTTSWNKVLVIMVICLSAQVHAQTLTIGDPAPKLEVYEWIKGTPIAEFKKGTTYVVEMGATWCKPCIAAIPELTRLANKYHGKVEVVSVFVQEINTEPIDIPNPKYVDKVRKFVEKQGEKMQYHVAVDGPKKTIEDTWINAMNRGKGVPQTFVIDQSGRVAAHLTGFGSKQLEELLESILNGTYAVQAQNKSNDKLEKTKIDYDWLKPLYVNNNGGDNDDFLFRSVLGKYKGNGRVGVPMAYLRSWHQINKDSTLFESYFVLQGRVQSINTSLSQLYYVAYADTLWNYVETRFPATMEYVDFDTIQWARRSYGEYWHAPILEVSDTTPFHTRPLSGENKWNYALTVPDKRKATAAYLQKLMREDLHRYFGYEVKVETRSMPCWYLKAYPEAAKLRTETPGEKHRAIESEIKTGESGVITQYSHKNGDIRDIIARLATEFNIGYSFSARNVEEPPFIDQTGIDYHIDYDITSEELAHFDNHNLNGVREFLNRIGLYLEKSEKPMKVVVIRDPVNQ